MSKKSPLSKGIILFVNLLILLFFNDVALAPAQRKKKKLGKQLEMNHCCAVWDSCGKTDWDYLDRLHLRAAYIIEGRK